MQQERVAAHVPPAGGDGRQEAQATGRRLAGPQARAQAQDTDERDGERHRVEHERDGASGGEHQATGGRSDEIGAEDRAG